MGNDGFKKDDPRYTGEFYSKYRMLNVENQKEYSGKFEIRMLLLNHVEEVPEEERNDNNGLYYWAKMFTVKSWEELQMVAKDNPMMKSFVGTVRKLSAEEKVEMACEARRRYSNDMATLEKELKKVEKQKEKMDQEKEKMDQEKEELDRQKEEMDRQRRAVKQEAKEAKQESEEVKQEAEKAKQEVEEAKKETEEAKQEAEEVKQKLQSAEQELREKERLIQELMAQIDK